MNTVFKRASAVYRTPFTRGVGLGAALAALAALLVTVPAEAAPTPDSTTTTKSTKRMLTPAQLASNVYKTVVIDTRTGKITESWLGIPPDSSMLISSRSTCNTTDGCYVAGRIPYADVGFYGTAGTRSGSWAYRSQIASGQYSVRGCWSGGRCSPRLSPRTQAMLNPMVTGTSFTIY